MNFNQIQYFILVGKYENVSQAARELHISQPTVSDSVRALEQELGVSLFHRVKNRLYLTEAGMYYHQRVSVIMDNLTQLNREMTLLGSNRKVIRLGVPPMASTVILPHLIQNFHRAYPDIQLDLKGAGSLELIQLLLDERIDLAVVSQSDKLEQNLANLTFQKITDAQLCFCVSKDHPMAMRESVDIHELAKEPLVLFSGGYITNEYLMQVFAQAGINPNVLLRLDQLSAIKNLVREGMGSSFWFPEVIHGSDDLVAIPLVQPMYVTLGLVWKNSRTTYQDVKIFSGFFRDFPFHNR